jgi:hypothetical protein
MLIGLVLHNMRSNEPANQHGLVSAPENPTGTAGKKRRAAGGCEGRSTRREVSRPALYVTHCEGEIFLRDSANSGLSATYNACAQAVLASPRVSEYSQYNQMLGAFVAFKNILSLFCG